MTIPPKPQTQEEWHATSKDDPMFSIATTPIQPKTVNAMTGVMEHFQSDSNFKKIYQSDESMSQLAELSAVCLNFGCQLAENMENESLHRLTAYGEDSNIAIFSFDYSRAETPGQRVFGLKLRPRMNISSVVNKISTLA